MAVLRWISIGLAAVLALVLVGLAVSPVGRVMLPGGAGIAAKQLCSLVFVSGLPPERAWDLYVGPLLGPAEPLVSYRLDTAEPSVRTRSLFVYGARAVHRPGLGCTLVQEARRDLEPSPADPDEDARFDTGGMALDVDHRNRAFDPDRLEGALDTLFASPGDGPPRNTLAAVVLHDGHLVAERYAPGIRPDTRLPGWSMTKSVTAVLAGILVARGAVDPDAVGAVARWAGTDDPRAAITLDHLLRMTSGLDITERNSGLDETFEMLFIEPDAAAYAAARPLQKDVGVHYEYMSGNTVLAMAHLQDAVGGTLPASHAFIQESLFRPLGMSRAVMEPDHAGTFIGSSFMLASAQEWARFGQFLLDGGRANGRALLSEGWLERLTAHTPESGDSGYGAGVWLAAERGAEPATTKGRLPEDAYFAWGFQGQFTFVIPSERLVIVRLGASNGGADPGALQFVEDVVAARLPE